MFQRCSKGVPKVFQRCSCYTHSRDKRLAPRGRGWRLLIQCCVWGWKAESVVSESLLKNGSLALSPAKLSWVLWLPLKTQTWPLHILCMRTLTGWEHSSMRWIWHMDNIWMHMAHGCTWWINENHIVQFFAKPVSPNLLHRALAWRGLRCTECTEWVETSKKPRKCLKNILTSSELFDIIH